MLYHSGIRVQRGQGIGSILGGLFRTILPKVASSGLKVAKQIVKSDIAKDVGRQLRDTATNSVVNMTADALEGKSARESLQNQLSSAKNDIAKTIRNSRKTKTPVKRKIVKKKKTVSKKSRRNFFDD